MKPTWVVYQKGGGRYKTRYIYEVTSQKGIEMLKEYDLGLSGDYSIIKSEIVKADNSIVPADKNRSSFVFNKLSEGDVIYIEFEENFTSSGRFYKDYIDNQSFESYYPFIKKIYRVFTKKENLNFEVKNGEIDFKKFKLKNYNVYQWQLENIKELDDYEDFMPAFNDVATTLHISTLNNWNEISNWYSDLVRSQMIVDETLKSAVATIFPDGFEQFSKEERIEKIYYYVTGDFTYSFVNFKQSGFVPQKPSKTIETKLGDCKDFSTLFVSLAKQVGVEAQLVLVLTSDFGKNAIVLPSTDFNHCIVKTTYNGEPQYIELTDKYLPFRSLPVNLRNAIVLDIPYMSNTLSNNIYNLDQDIKRTPSILENKATIVVSEESAQIALTTSFTGDATSYYFGMFDEQNTEVLKDQLLQDLLQRTSADITLNDFNIIKNNRLKSELSYAMNITYNKKINKIGSLKTFQVPFFSTPYTQTIINLEKRSYPIYYKSYEFLDGKRDTYTIVIPEENEFIEIPENKTINFKDHKVSIKYLLENKNKLQISMTVDPDFKDIDITSYDLFKEFVRDFLEVKEQLVVFK